MEPAETNQYVQSGTAKIERLILMFHTVSGSYFSYIMELSLYQSKRIAFLLIGLLRMKNVFH